MTPPQRNCEKPRRGIRQGIKVEHTNTQDTENYMFQHDSVILELSDQLLQAVSTLLEGFIHRDIASRSISSKWQVFFSNRIASRQWGNEKAKIPPC